MTTKHTPGPWGIKTTKTGAYAIFSGETGAWVAHTVKSTPLTQLANARLIAAAPELLEALKLCRQHMYEHASNTPDGAFDALCAAIAKATGGNHD